MTHLDLELLVQLREPGREPGLAEAEQHLAACPVCRAEADRLDQRVARLKALPALKPSRDGWPAVRNRLRTEIRHRRVRKFGGAGVALAASVALLLFFRDASAPSTLTASTALSDAMARSGQLEQLLENYNADGRMTDGHTDRVAGALEDRIARIDRELEMAQLLRNGRRDAALLDLYRERVGLLDALMDVHLTRASNVGL
jgi:hypothetical protein